MQFERQQLEAVVIELVRREPWVPQTKLLKMLFEVDFDFYEGTLTHLTGARYVAMNYGPMLDNYKRLLQPVVAAYFLVAATQGYAGDSYRLRAEPECRLGSDVIEVLDRVVERNRGKSSAQMVEELHQDSAWRVVWKGFRGERIPYSLAAQRPDYPERPAVQPVVLQALEDAVSAGLILHDHLVAADNLARELGRSGLPVDIEVQKDWVGLFVEDGVELEVAVAHDRARHWRVFFMADDESEIRSGIILRPAGLRDLISWFCGEDGWEERNLEVGNPSRAKQA